MAAITTSPAITYDWITSATLKMHWPILPVSNTTEYAKVR